MANHVALATVFFLFDVHILKFFNQITTCMTMPLTGSHKARQ